MQAGVQRTVIILVAIIALIMGLVVAKVLRKPALDPQQLAHIGVFLKDPPAEIAEFELVAQDGSAFSKNELRGQWSLLFFGFTYCPDICPATLAQVAQVKQQLDEKMPSADIQYILVSVDPDRDTPARLQEYVTYFDPAFLGLTGSLQNIYDFAIGLNAIFAKVPQENGDYLMDHSSNLVLINPEGQYHGFLKTPRKVGNVVTALQAIIDQ